MQNKLNKIMFEIDEILTKIIQCDINQKKPLESREELCHLFKIKLEKAKCLQQR